MVVTVTPLVLAPNTFDHFYRGGRHIAELRGSTPGTHRPEEWLGSVVTRFGESVLGLTTVGDRTLREEIEADPIAWLGAAHVARHGPSPSVLVKLLDPAQRLPVHLHPTRNFARRHLDCPYGKTEAWIILEAEPAGGEVFVGTHRNVARREWEELVDAQATDAMLALLRPLRVRPGDAVLVPAGIPHAIGPDLLVLELQEPTDLSILLEWRGFDLDGAADGHLGLGFDVAIGAIRPDALGDDELERLVVAAAERPSLPPNSVAPVMPAGADPYFRAWSVESTTDVDLPAGFGVLLVTAGDGRLVHRSGEMEVHRGDALVIPATSHPCTLVGELSAYLAQPPAADAPEPDEWDMP